MAKRGLRVLAFAYRDGAELNGAPYTTPDIETQLVFLGLVALSDPVRPEVPAAIHACHTAGIRVIMITGDYALTAASIGEQIGLGQTAKPRTFTGVEVSEMDDQQLRAILAEGETIFARVAPEHKLRVVSLLKQMGEIVAVTGDGVNDAPALKKADIGIAMGLRGNDVAKEASRMILTDDNFSSIVAAIEEGRAIFDNIKRFAAYVLNSNPQEMYPYLFWVLVPRHAAGDDRDGRVGGRCGNGSDSGDGLGHRAAGRRDHGAAAATARRKDLIARFHPALLLRAWNTFAAQLLRHLLLYGLGAWRMAARRESCQYAGVARRPQV